MARLTPAERSDRLALDYRTTVRLASPALASIRAFGSEAELKVGREVTPVEAEAGRAAIYVVEYTFPILVGPGPTTDRAVARFDLLAGGNYPFSDPSAAILSRPLPWSPHVQSANGVVCIGDGWRTARGRMLAAQLVVHVMRLLNCDEPDREPWYTGWNAAAVRYWRTTMGCRPQNPDLQYPALPAEITHGARGADAVFQACGEAGGVRATNMGFRPLGESAPDQSSGFRPLGGAR
jgi:hypothetical protein